jgi:hypothetical protein
MDDVTRYRAAIVIYDALRGVIPTFRAKKAVIRAMKPITPTIQKELGPKAPIAGSNRDRIVCALVNKACNTHAAIRLLTDAGHGDDAMALGRVLLENATLLRWLLIDQVYRLDLYSISDALFRRRWAELVKKHYKHRPPMVKAAEHSVDAEVLAVAAFFGDTHHKWAQVLHPNGEYDHVNFKEMMEEVAAHGGEKSAFMHDVIYFLHSAFVHSTVSSMRSFKTLKKENCFRFDLGPNAVHRSVALAGANTGLLLALQAAADYLGFSDIDADLDEIFEQLRASSKAAAMVEETPAEI